MVKKTVGAKNISKWGIVLAIVIVILYNFVYMLKTGDIPTPDKQNSVIMLGAFCIASFSPVYISIILDKIFGKKAGE